MQDENGVSIRLVQVKSRMAPLKKVTIPRLELFACNIAASLAAATRTALEDEEISCIYLTDSSTALAWIQRDNMWGVYVGNRVREINTLSNKEDWRHVPGGKNPADLPSRGCSISQFIDSRWWEGPLWLRKPADCWPVSADSVDEEQVQIEKPKTPVLNLCAAESDAAWYVPTSSYYKNVRIMVYVLRFVRHIKEQNCSRGDISLEELNRAVTTLFCWFKESD